MFITDVEISMSWSKIIAAVGFPLTTCQEVSRERA